MSFYRRHHTLREIYYQSRLTDEQELGSVWDISNCSNYQELHPLSADKHRSRGLISRLYRLLSRAWFLIGLSTEN